jgi:hypothetical protein
MAVTSEPSAVRRNRIELRTHRGSLRSRYGDVCAMRRLLGDRDRFEFDPTDPEGRVTVARRPTTQRESAMTVIDGRPTDPALSAAARDQGLDGYHR